MTRRIQEYNLVDRLTVMENVLSGRLGYVSFLQALRRTYPPDDISAAYELLDRVGLTDNVDARADALSGGQRQRLAIARAIIQDPKILLLDDSVSAVDAQTEFLMRKALDEVMVNRTSITVTQRLRTLIESDLVINREARRQTAAQGLVSLHLGNGGPSVARASGGLCQGLAAVL